MFRHDKDEFKKKRMNHLHVFRVLHLSTANLHVIMVIACQTFFNKKTRHAGLKWP